MWTRDVSLSAVLALATGVQQTAQPDGTTVYTGTAVVDLVGALSALERRAGLLSVQGVQQATIHAAMFMRAGAHRVDGQGQQVAATLGSRRLSIMHTRHEAAAVHMAVDWLTQNEWIAENKAGQENFQRMREEAAGSQVEKVGKDLRSMMPWIDD